MLLVDIAYHYVTWAVTRLKDEGSRVR